MMNHTDLMMFYEAALCKGVRKASERLGIAPSAVSKHIKRLEQDMRVKLLHRSSQGVELTPAGEVCFHCAEDILSAQRRCMIELESLKGLKSGRVTLYSTEGHIDFVTQAVTLFQQEHPGVVFKVIVASTAEVQAAVSSGDADIGLAFTPVPDDTIECALRLPAPLVVGVSPSHALAGKSRISLRELSRHAIVMPTADFGIRRMVDAACLAERIVFEPFVTTNSIASMKSIVLASRGACIISLISVQAEVEAGSIVAIALSHPLLNKTCVDVGVLGRRRLPAAVRAFLQHLRRQAATHGDGVPRPLALHQGPVALDTHQDPHRAA